MLRPEALAALTYLAGKVERRLGRVEAADGHEPDPRSRVSGASGWHQSGGDSEYSLHTTGWSFDIRRKYASDRQARAFQFALDRLRAHAILDYAYEPAAIHVTVSENAEILLDG